MAAGAGLVLFSGFTSTRAISGPVFSEYPFTLGVASGDPSPDGFVIWTRLAPKPLDPDAGMSGQPAIIVQWQVAEDAAFRTIVKSGEAIAMPELGHSVHVEVAGLRPRRPYWYRFAIPGIDASPTGMVRTLPEAGSSPDRIRLGIAGCQNYPTGLYTAYAYLAKEPELDAIFHYGDYIYEAGSKDRPGNGGREHIGPEPYNLPDYRRRYALYKTDKDLQAAHASAAFIASYDDHEVDNNWVSDFDIEGTDPEIFALRRIAALQAWYENLPMRRAQFPHPAGMTAYRRIDFGRLMRMHVLDTRAYRSRPPCGEPKSKSCVPHTGPDSTFLGAAQEAWLAQGLASGAGWNLLAQQVLMMPFDKRAPGATEPDFPTDTWSGYPDARRRLTRTIADQRLTNVVVATGASHKHFAGTVPMRDADLTGPAAAVEFLATSISSGGNGSPTSSGLEFALANNPHMKLIHDQRGYQLFEVTAKTWRADLKVVERVDVPNAPLSTLKSFIVTPDRAALHDA
jgi:alkaline phosphatase D